MNKFIFDIMCLITNDDGDEIPVAFLKYKGDKETYIVFSEIDNSPAYSSDNKCRYSVKQFDFDIYTKGNYLNILKEVKKRLTNNGFTWVEDSPDMYENDTGYYHKTTTFEIENYIEE